MKLSRNWLRDLIVQLDTLGDDAIREAFSSLGWALTSYGPVGDDALFDVEEKPERPDCCCVRGFARELAGALDLPLVKIGPEEADSSLGSVFEHLDLEVTAQEGCRRLSLEMAGNLKWIQTPDWMQARLRLLGRKPRNIFSDVCTYVSLELGTPVDCYDFRGAERGSLFIRESFPGESFPGPRGEDLPLPSGTLLVSDENFQIQGLAGLYLQDAFSLREDTDTLILAAGDYDPQALQQAAEAFRISLPASCPDPMLTVTALERVQQIFRNLGCAEAYDGCLDCLQYVPQPAVLPLPPDMEESQAEVLLRRMEIPCRDGMAVLPSFRRDLQSPQDLKEELLRLSRL